MKMTAKWTFNPFNIFLLFFGLWIMTQGVEAVTNWWIFILGWVVASIRVELK
jgi:hypothetical protein